MSERGAVEDSEVILEIHPSTVAHNIDAALVTLELLAQRALQRNDRLGKAAWLIARDAMVRASDAFREARKVQSNRRNARGLGSSEHESEEHRLRVALRAAIDLADEGWRALCDDPHHERSGDVAQLRAVLEDA